ncbi:MAG: WGR domain-containing protein, partial [Myxococcales bacterium]|nr:WGR domain-containing protein [Myxococcales bacterium]
MRRFELVEGSSSKFWEIAQEGSAYTVCYGRIGTSGQTQTKDLGDAAKAAAAVAKLIAEKTKKGYSEVGGASGGAANVAPAKAAPAKAAPAKASAASTPAKVAPAKAPVVATPPPATKPSVSNETAASEPGVPSAALLALAIPTRRFPHGDHPAHEHSDRVVHQRGLIGALDEIATMRVTDVRNYAWAFSIASAEEFEGAKAYGKKVVEQLQLSGDKASHAISIAAFLLHQDEPEELLKTIDAIFDPAKPWTVYPTLKLLALLPDRALWAKLLKAAFSVGNDDALPAATALLLHGSWVLPEFERLMTRGNAGSRAAVIAAVSAADSLEAALFLLGYGDDRRAEDGVRTLLADRKRAARAALTLATRTTKRTFARDVLERLLRQDPSLDSVATTDLQRAVIDAIQAEHSGPMASDVPAVLAKGPWEGRKVAKPVVVAGLVAPDEPVEEVWPPGLREKWSELPWSGWAHYSPADRQSNVLRNFTNGDGAASPEDAVKKLRGNERTVGWVLEYGGESLVLISREHAMAFWNAVHPTTWKLNEKATRGVVAVLG